MTLDRNAKELVELENRSSEKTVAFRKKFDLVYSFIRSCAVCSTALPPIDLLCGVCWKSFGQLANRGAKLRQKDYPFPVYSLLTWTPETEHFVKPFIYGFKGGRAVRAAERLATFFLAERTLTGFAEAADPLTRQTRLTLPPSRKFDHASLWSYWLGERMKIETCSLFKDVSPRLRSQKHLSQTERAERRFELREQFAGCRQHEPDAPVSAKRIVFADDVITSGATAMAAYMALGDPDKFEVWTLAARPRLAGKSQFC